MVFAEATTRCSSHIAEDLGHRAQTHIIRRTVILRVSKRHTVHTARARRRRSVHRTALDCDIVRICVSHRTALCRVIRCALGGFSIVGQPARTARTTVHDVVRRAARFPRRVAIATHTARPVHAIVAIMTLGTGIALSVVTEGGGHGAISMG